jgi:hypothetical protein
VQLVTPGGAQGEGWYDRMDTRIVVLFVVLQWIIGRGLVSCWERL